MRSLVPRVLFLAVASCWVAPASALSTLGRKTTAEQAWRYLDQNNELAPYARTGGTAVVTGGNSGIGAETVKALAKAGMRVVLCARNPASASEVLQGGLSASERERVEVQRLDLSDLASVRAAADSILETCGTIDCLVNNAGIMALPNRETSGDGIEMQFAVNHVGHHLLTRLLLPGMNAGGRVVSVASVAHTGAREPLDDWESRDSYSRWGAYSESKLCNILFAKQLQREAPGIDSVALHPGVIRSPLWKHTVPALLQPAVGLIANKNPAQGAATSVYCALAKSVEGGGYYDDCAVALPSTTARSEKLRTALWRYTEELLASKGFELPALGASATTTPSQPNELVETK